MTIDDSDFPGALGTYTAAGLSGIVAFIDPSNYATDTFHSTFDNIVSIPEPTSISLSLIGLVAMAAVKRRRRKLA